MNAVSPDPLAALRPIHLPPPVSWWPPAPGWWILLAALCLAVVWQAATFLRGRVKRSALAELRSMKNSNVPDRDFVALVSIILKRYALHCFPSRQVAGLTGNAWLKFLDQHASQRDFISGPGRVLMDMAYGAQGSVDRDALLHLAEQWIKGVKPGSYRRNSK